MYEEVLIYAHAETERRTVTAEVQREQLQVEEDGAVTGHHEGLAAPEG